MNNLDDFSGVFGKPGGPDHPEPTFLQLYSRAPVPGDLACFGVLGFPNTHFSG